MKTVDEYLAEIAAVAHGQDRTEEERQRLLAWHENNKVAIGRLNLAALAIAADFIQALGGDDREAAETVAAQTLLRASIMVVRSMKARMGLPFIPARHALVAAMVADEVAALDFTPPDEARTAARALGIVDPLRLIALETSLGKVIALVGRAGAGEDISDEELQRVFTEAAELVAAE